MPVDAELPGVDPAGEQPALNLITGTIRRVAERFVPQAIPHVVEIARTLDAPSRHVVQATSRYLKAHPHLGSSDRAIVGDLVHAIARWHRRIDRALGDAMPADGVSMAERAPLRCALLLAAIGYDPRLVHDSVAPHSTHAVPLPGPDRLETAVDALDALAPIEASDAADLSLRASMPAWVVERLIDQYGWLRAKRIVTSSRGRAWIGIRANTLAMSRDGAVDALVKAGIDAQPSPLCRHAVIVDGSARVAQMPAYRNGGIEIQDVGSQLVAMLTGAEPGMRFADVCAGAGGKTLAVAAMMENRGEILSLDVSSEKLRELERRARRAGCSIAQVVNVSGQHASGSPLPKAYRSWIGGTDVVLADVPCSGSGAWRRVPDGPDHLQKDELSRLSARQGEILSRYAPLVRRGGRLVYATCSLFAEENEQVVDAWLHDNPDFHAISAVDVLRREEVRADVTEGDWLALTPEGYGTDGFFGAVLERRAG